MTDKHKRADERKRKAGLTKECVWIPLHHKSRLLELGDELRGFLSPAEYADKQLEDK